MRGILSEVCGIIKQLEPMKNKRKAYKVMCKKMLKQYQQIFPLEQYTTRAQSHNQYSKAINTHEKVKGRVKRLELQINLITHNLKELMTLNQCERVITGAVRNLAFSKGFERIE